MSLKSQSNFRVSVSYKQEIKLFLFPQDSDLCNIKTQIGKRFGIQTDVEMKIYHKTFKAEIEDSNLLKDDDEVYILTQNDAYDPDSEPNQKFKEEEDFGKIEDALNIKEKEELTFQTSLKAIEEKLNTVSLTPDFQEKEYMDREELIIEVKEWAHSFGFALATREGEKVNNKGIKTTSLYCNVEDCKFFLRFKTNETNLYKLFSSYLEHSGHDKINYCLVDSKVKAQISNLSTRMKSKADLKEVVIENCNSSLSYHQVYYQSQKVKDEVYGKPSDDAKRLLLHLIENQHTKSYKFFFEKDQKSGELLKLIYVSKSMFHKYQIYHDDSTFQKK